MDADDHEEENDDGKARPWQATHGLLLHLPSKYAHESRRRCEKCRACGRGWRGKEGGRKCRERVKAWMKVVGVVVWL